MEWFLYSWPTLILLGLGLRMALRLTYGARGPDLGDPIFVFLNTNSWVLIALGLAPAVIGGAATFVGGLISVLAASALVEVVTQRRAAQRRSTATMLALMVDRGLALDSSLLFAGQSMSGVAGRSAARLFRALDQGMPLADAIATHPRALPPEALAYLAAGQTKEAEAAALRELSRSERSELASIWRACIDRASYLFFVVAMMVAVLTFIMVKIVPEMEQIFGEFDTKLPMITELAVQVSYLFTRYLGVPIVIALVVLLLGSSIVAVCYLADLPMLRPWVEFVFRGRTTAHVLRILAVATRERQPLARAMIWLAHVYPSATIRHRLSEAASAINSGIDWRDALAEAHIVTPSEQGLLKAAERAGNLPWALRQIAKRREQRAVYRWATVLQIAYPAAILLLGGFVAFYVIALFVPIVQLIYGLAEVA